MFSKETVHTDLPGLSAASPRSGYPLVQAAATPQGMYLESTEIIGTGCENLGVAKIYVSIQRRQWL